MQPIKQDQDFNQNSEENDSHKQSDSLSNKKKRILDEFPGFFDALPSLPKKKKKKK